MTETLRVGILGAGGYTGAELVRLVHQHPRLRLVLVAAREKAGKRLTDVLPGALGVAGLNELVLEAFDPSDAAALAKRIDVAFLCLPHAASARAGKALYEAGVQVVDLSADFRLKDAAVYTKTYGEHPATELLSKAVYGQPELHRSELPGAKLIAAPGCHVTTSLLSLAPLLKSKLIETSPIIIDSKTGGHPHPPFIFRRLVRGFDLTRSAAPIATCRRSSRSCRSLRASRSRFASPRCWRRCRAASW